DAPKHPYTRALLRSMPDLYAGRRHRLSTIRGTVPHPLRRPLGCPFHDRCDFAIAGVCDSVEPPTVTVEGGHEVTCHLYADDAAPDWTVLEAPGLGSGPDAAQTSVVAGQGDRLGDPTSDTRRAEARDPL